MSTPSRSVLLRRRVAAALVLAIVAAGGVYLPMTLLAPIGAASASIDPVETLVRDASELTFPGVGASGISAVGFDGVLASSGSEEALPIASISKVISTLVVLDAKPLAVGEDGPSIVFNQVDVALYGKYQRVGGTVEPVTAGLAMSQRDLLEVVLVSSANNYAESLVGWAFGSQSEFVDATEAWLTAGGFDSTVIVEPTGVSPSNVSSIPDLVGIAKLALGNPVVAEIVASKSVDVPYVGTLTNTNRLLGVESIDGIKTGTLEEAGSCLLFSTDYTVGSSVVTVVGVVLGGENREALESATRSLVDGIAAGFHEVPLAEKGEVFASYSTDWGQSANAVAAEASSVLVWSDTPVSGEVAVQPLVKAGRGDAIGEVTFTVGDARVSVPLVLDAGIADPGPWWRLSHPLELLPGGDGNSDGALSTLFTGRRI
ncbi:MAG: D-alanyl-D-alanine carboxypeptidase [Microbacteriaceae bacterium]|nr:D-alanyl-D-alanine carboxypeptidase [Microbacteriaceae bacterium]